MQNLRSVLTFLATLFLILMIWGGYSLISIVFEEHPNENNAYIPEDATFVARINSRKLIKSSISSIILHEDEEILELIQASFSGQHGEGFKNIGTEFNSDIILFNQSENGHEFVGVLLNLNSPRFFKKNIGSFIKNNEVSSSNDDVGLVYFELSDSLHRPIPKNILQKKADAILAKKSQFNIRMLESDLDNSIVQTWSKDGLFGDVNVAHNTKLSFHIFEDKLIIDGDLAMNTDSKNTLKKELAPKGLHINSDQISAIVQDSISSFLSNFNVKDAKLTGFSINYYGLELITDPSLFFAPKFDALLSFKDEIPLKPSIDSLIAAKFIRRSSARSINYYGLEVYFDRIDSKTIRIGTSKQVSYVEPSKKNSFRICGTMSSLTNVDGKKSWIDAIHKKQEYKSINRIFNAIRLLDVQIGTPINGKSKVHAVIQFKKNTSALNSMIELMLQANQIRKIAGSF